ncbi:MAG: hypothetical protein P9X27_00635 [Candidatus Kaelpia aquatica]|nr:hypothetical protein [Candidatus Kaelpia aquatica]
MKRLTLFAVVFVVVIFTGLIIIRMADAAPNLGGADFGGKYVIPLSQGTTYPSTQVDSTTASETTSPATPLSTETLIRNPNFNRKGERYNIQLTNQEAIDVLGVLLDSAEDVYIKDSISEISSRLETLEEGNEIYLAASGFMSLGDLWYISIKNADGRTEEMFEINIVYPEEFTADLSEQYQQTIFDIEGDALDVMHSLLVCGDYAVNCIKQTVAGDEHDSVKIVYSSSALPPSSETVAEFVEKGGTIGLNPDLDVRSILPLGRQGQIIGRKLPNGGALSYQPMDFRFHRSGLTWEEIGAAINSGYTFVWEFKVGFGPSSYSYPSVSEIDGSLKIVDPIGTVVEEYTYEQDSYFTLR